MNKYYTYTNENILTGSGFNERDAQLKAERDGSNYASGIVPDNLTLPEDQELTITQLRRRAYANETNYEGDYLDGIVKLASSDQDIIAEGQEQVGKYYADCLAVKARFPKE